MTAKLVLQNLTKVYDDRSVVKDFTLSVSDGEFVALLGPSGCGKSTILAMIAGFEQPDAGSVSIDGRCVDALPPHRRNVGLVMQDYAVFSRMTVRQNLEFGLKMQSVRSSERRVRVSELVERLSLGDLLKRKGDALNLSENAARGPRASLDNKTVAPVARRAHVQSRCVGSQSFAQRVEANPTRV